MAEKTLIPRPLYNSINETVKELRIIQNVKKTAVKTVTFNVSIHCEKCVKKINENISFEKGVKGLEVSLDKKTVTITYDPAKTDVTKLKAAIEKLGYKVTVQES